MFHAKNGNNWPCNAHSTTQDEDKLQKVTLVRVGTCVVYCYRKDMKIGQEEPIVRLYWPRRFPTLFLIYSNVSSLFNDMRVNLHLGLFSRYGAPRDINIYEISL